MDRKTAESAFFDDAYAQHEPALNGFYEISAGIRVFEEAVFRDCEGRATLEYGCGMGGHAFALAERGANVTGIDISEVAVRRARERAGHLPRLAFRVADAESLPFESSSFDFVCGTSILHHLEIARALQEIRRVLRPSGRALFYEPVGYNPAANLYRWLTPDLHTKDEHPLVRKDFDEIRRAFPGTQFHWCDFLSVVAIPLLRFSAGQRILRQLDRIDRFILTPTSPFHLLANVVVIEMNP